MILKCCEVRSTADTNEEFLKRGGSGSARRGHIPN